MTTHSCGALSAILAEFRVCLFSFSIHFEHILLLHKFRERIRLNSEKSGKMLCILIFHILFKLTTWQETEKRYRLNVPIRNSDEWQEIYKLFSAEARIAQEIKISCVLAIHLNNFLWWRILYTIFRELVFCASLPIFERMEATARVNFACEFASNVVQKISIFSTIFPSMRPPTHSLEYFDSANYYYYSSSLSPRPKSHTPELDSEQSQSVERWPRNASNPMKLLFRDWTIIRSMND